MGERYLPDALLLCDESLRPCLEARLEAEALDGDGAAVDATKDRVPLENRQVPANRLGGDVECLREGVDLDPSRGAGQLEDVLLAFLRVHEFSSPRSVVETFIASYGGHVKRCGRKKINTEA